MFKAHRALPALLAAAVLTAAPACASRGALYRYPTSTRGADDRAYRNGYDEGRRAGEDDARRGRSFDYRRHDDYRDADEGYRDRGNTSRNAYRQAFRQGFADGYDEGYRRYARAGRGTYGYPNNPNIYRGSGRYPSYGYGSPAAANGYRDGVEQGRNDARHGDRYDPIRASRYRSGDHDYDRRYGSRDDYKREYRAAFQQGYDQGYRDGRR
jgi:flagellar biosynthesis/type III secretory pathway protein FliH